MYKSSIDVRFFRRASGTTWHCGHIATDRSGHHGISSGAANVAKSTNPGNPREKKWENTGYMGYDIYIYDIPPGELTVCY